LDAERTALAAMALGGVALDRRDHGSHEVDVAGPIKCTG
jgi:hypothetical protein